MRYVVTEKTKLTDIGAYIILKIMYVYYSKVLL